VSCCAPSVNFLLALLEAMLVAAIRADSTPLALNLTNAYSSVFSMFRSETFRMFLGNTTVALRHGDL
jgi:hypothetical protein